MRHYKHMFLAYDMYARLAGTDSVRLFCQPLRGRRAGPNRTEQPGALKDVKGERESGFLL